MYDEKDVTEFFRLREKGFPRSWTYLFHGDITLKLRNHQPAYRSDFGSQPRVALYQASKPRDGPEDTKLTPLSDADIPVPKAIPSFDQTRRPILT